jgi:undecaprenyl-diphosphatase
MSLGGLKNDRGGAVVRQVSSNLDGWASMLRRVPRLHGGPRPWFYSGCAAAGVAIMLVIVVAALMATVDAGAIAVARALPRDVRAFFEVVTDFGKSGWFLWPLGIALILLGLLTGPAIGRIHTAVVAALAVRLTFLFAAIAIPGLFGTIVKRLIGRARPYVGEHVNPYLYDPFAWKASYASLPSGHATTAFAVVVAIGAIWPRSRPYVWAYALLIVASRIAVTAHYPSDVFAGAIVGAAGALLVRDWFAARRLAFSVDGEGRVQPMAGPSWRRIKRTTARLLRS